MSKVVWVRVVSWWLPWVTRVNDKFHAYREITSDSEPVYLYMKTDNNYNPNKIILSELWGTATDAQAHLTIKP